MYKDSDKYDITQQLKALAAKVVKDFKAPAGMNGEELSKVNQLVCGFTKQQADSITTEAFRCVQINSGSFLCITLILGSMVSTGKTGKHACSHNIQSPYNITLTNPK